MESRKKRKEKIEKLKPKDYENYTEKTYSKINYELNEANTISNGNYTICTNEKVEFLRKTEEYCMFIQSSCWYNALVTNKELQIH